MPSFNPGIYLRQALESVIPQLGPFDALIVQDGGSTDGSIPIFEEYAGSSLSLKVEADNGQADALNRALARAETEWIGWLNADDLLLPGAVEAFRNAVVTGDRSSQIIYGDYQTVDGDGMVLQNLMSGEIDSKILMFGRRRPFSGAFFVKRDLLVEAGGFDPSFQFCMDYELYLRLWGKGPKAQRIAKTLGALRIHAGTKTHGQPWAFVREARRARQTRDLRGIEHFRSSISTAMHALTIAATPIRATPIYRSIRTKARNRTK